MIDINYMTIEQWPKAHEVWADDGFERINQLLDKINIKFIFRK